MNDITMHFLACFIITVIVFVIQIVLYVAILSISNPYEKMIFAANERKLLNSAVFRSIIASIFIGFLKEFWDIWFSDPQFHDLVADAGGAIFAGIIIWLVGMKWIEWRFR